MRDYWGEKGSGAGGSADDFDSYYRDISRSIKNLEIDLVIVVNMFLTGFDSKHLNTLWVDKPLHSHGLIQAFSRTNRILDSVKTFGNIVSFRPLDQEIGDALKLFGDPESQGLTLLKPFQHYQSEYEAKTAELLEKYPLKNLPKGEQAKKEFAILFGEILRLRNVLECFSEFQDGKQVSAGELQDYKSLYLETSQEFRERRQADLEPIDDDVVFEIELIKQAEINLDYILTLVERMREYEGQGEDEQAKKLEACIARGVRSSPTLHNKADLIQAFVKQVSSSSLSGTPEDDIPQMWQRIIAESYQKEEQKIIMEDDLKPTETREFMRGAFRDGRVQIEGPAITRLLPPMDRYGPDYTLAKEQAAEKLTSLHKRFSSLVVGGPIALLEA